MLRKPFTDRRLAHIFGVLRLKKKDARIYQTLTELRQATASQLASRVGLPRQTTYSILLKLQEHGLITLSSRSGTKMFIADPDNLQSAIKRKHQELSTLSPEVLQASLSIRKHQKLNFKKPAVKYYDGSFGLKNLFGSMTDYYATPHAVKEFRGYGLNTYKNASVRTFLSHFIKKRKKMGVKTKLLIGKGPEDFTKGKSSQLDISLRHMNTQPQNAGIYILENKIYMFSFTDNAGLVIENKAIARFLKSAFDDHWEKTPAAPASKEDN